MKYAATLLCLICHWMQQKQHATDAFVTHLRFHQNHHVIHRTNHVLSGVRVEGVDYVIEEGGVEYEEDDDDDETDMSNADLLEVAKLEKELLATARAKLKSIELKAPSAAYAETLSTDGVVRINQCISPEQCALLASHITNELKISLAQVDRGEVNALDRFSSLLSSSNRYDFKLPLDDTIQSCLKGLFRKGTVLGSTLSSTIGDKAELFELAAFVTLPGADRQCVHADTIFTKQPVVFTIALALQDVTEDMGPTLFFPETHTKQMHRSFDNAKTKDRFLLKTPHKLSLLQTGDVHLYDSRCLHCGTENLSNRPRVLFYVSFRNPKAGKQGDDFWNVASIRPENSGQYALKQFMA